MQAWEVFGLGAWRAGRSARTGRVFVARCLGLAAAFVVLGAGCGVLVPDVARRVTPTAVPSGSSTRTVSPGPSPAHRSTRISDVNGDGGVDVVYATPAPMSAWGWHGFSGMSAVPGSVSVVYGGGVVQTVSQDQLGDTTRDGWWSGTFGASIAVGDVNCDGFADVVVGNWAEGDSGEIWALWGSSQGISADRASKLLTGIDEYNRIGFSVAFLAVPVPTLAIQGTASAKSTEDWPDAPVDLYPVRDDGSLGPVRHVPLPRSGGIYTMAASDDLLVVGMDRNGTDTEEEAGEVALVRILNADLDYVMTRITQDSPGVPGHREEGDRFGNTVSVFHGYVAVGAPYETITGHQHAGEVQPFRVSGTGTTLEVTPLPVITAPGTRLFRSSTEARLGTSVQVYRPCRGSYGVLIGTGTSPAADMAPPTLTPRAIQAPFRTSPRCKTATLARALWGAAPITVSRVGHSSPAAEAVIAATGEHTLTAIDPPRNPTSHHYPARTPQFAVLAAPAS